MSAGTGREGPPGPCGAGAPGRRARTALVLSGGVALGAFEAGLYEVLEERGVDWILGSSAGAVNAAIIAGNPPGRGAEALRRFWGALADDPMPWTSFWLGPPPPAGAWRRAQNEAAAMRALLLGRPGLFRRRLSPAAESPPSLYDLEPLRRHLPEHLDFARLGTADAPRLTVVATDVESGDRVTFDTARGDRIGPEHILASGALMPLFAPVEIDGRLLCDGGLASNAPLDLVLEERAGGPVRCVVAELFARAGSRPGTLPAAATRAGDLTFGNQTWRMVEAAAREQRLRDVLARLSAAVPAALREDPSLAPLLAEAEAERRELALLVLGYRGGTDEAGLGKPFDFSRATLADRWEAGARMMRQALAELDSPTGGRPLAPGLSLIEVNG